MLSNYISWIVFGALTGWTISQIFPAVSPRESISNILIGIGGVFCTGLILQIFLGDGFKGFNVSILTAAIAASVILLTTLRNAARD